MCAYFDLSGVGAYIGVDRAAGGIGMEVERASKRFSNRGFCASLAGNAAREDGRLRMADGSGVADWPRADSALIRVIARSSTFTSEVLFSVWVGLSSH